MFDKPNQLIFYINILLGTLGILTILLSDYIVIGLFLSISALLLIRDQYHQNKPAFTISHLEKILTIYDTNGKQATQTQKQTITTNHAANSELWFKNIHSAGTISNLKINGHPPVEQRDENGVTHISMKLSPELKAAETFDITLSYDCKNAFTKTQETLSHVVDIDTKLLRFVVELPEGRPIASARIFCRHGDEDEILASPVITGQKKIEADIKNPILGAEYRLQWDWPEADILKKLSQFFGCTANKR